MKKATMLFILTAILLLSFSVCSGESNLKLFWDGNTYNAGEGAAATHTFPFKDAENGDIISLSDGASGIKSEISVDALDEDAMLALRDYFNDNKSTDNQLFDKYVKLQRSYIPAMQDLFTVSFLYGNQGKPDSETSMKLLYDGMDTVFGQESAVYLYNIFNSEGLSSNEETHLDLSVPSMDTHSLISIRITLKSDSLNEETAKKITTLLGSLRPEGMPPQTAALKVLNDKNILNAASTGIYGYKPTENQKLTLLEDKQTGFSLYYPSSFVPYMNNGLGGRLQYKSFKINPNHIFSISSEAMEPGTSLSTVISRFKARTGSSVTAEGKQEVRGRSFSYLKYDVPTSGSAIHMTDYYTSDNSILYKLQLSSRLEEPSSAILKEFNSILESFRTVKPVNDNAMQVSVPNSYVNKEEGYSFAYPDGWKLTDISENVSHDRFRLVYPELSGPLDVTISEGELKNKISIQELPSCITGKSDKEADANVLTYISPYEGSQSRILNLSYRLEGSAIYVYRLLDYLDSFGRNRLSYCIDIIKDKKIYSMFIAVGEYETNKGRIKSEDINSAVNAIASSFHLEATVESEVRTNAGETRNRKVVFIEESLQNKIDPGLKVIGVENTASDGSLYVKTTSTKEKGYYKVKPDFENAALQILGKTPESTILKSELEKLKAAYSNRIITGTFVDEANMMISIDSRKDNNSPILTRTYRVDVSFTDKSIVFQTVRANHAEELKRESRIYLYLFFSADIDIQFSTKDAFKDIEVYADKNVMYRTLVYVSYGSLKGFMVLEVDPSDDEIKAVSFKPMDSILQERDDLYGSSWYGYKITDTSFDSNAFILKLTLKSNTDGSVKTESFKILYNPDKLILDYFYYTPLARKASINLSSSPSITAFTSPISQFVL